MTDIKILNEPLNAAACIAAVADDECGGTSVFMGTVRSKTDEKKVIRLEYECYSSMALKEMKKITEDAMRSWDVRNMIIHHRTGILYVGDIAVIIAVNAPHRNAAFNACSYAIDTLKKTVPVWKKEVFKDGEEWVSAYP